MPNELAAFPQVFKCFTDARDMALHAIGSPRVVAEHTSSRSKPSVLIVDDDVDICGVVAFKLEGLGFEVLVEHDGDAGLAAARIERPDLIVLDWMMPRLTGIEVCLAVRADAAIAATPVILLTAKAQEADVARGFAAGIDDFIVKPFSPRDLASRIDRLLARAGR